MIHIIPPNDTMDHTQDIYCECQPCCLPPNKYDFEELAVHRPDDMRHLIRHAEAIRLAESVRLWEEIERDEPQRTLAVVPFEDMGMVYLPMKGHRL